MKKYIFICVFLVFFVTLSACAGTESAVEPVPIPPTEKPAEAPAPPPSGPTPEPAPAPTATPDRQFFRDDFTDELHPGWDWENKNPANLTITDDGWLEIIGESDSLLGDNVQNNLLWYPLPEGNFTITAHLRAKPFENFQQATIYIYEDPDNYIAINRGYCDLCPPEGSGFYMEYKIDGAWGGYDAATEAEDVYLRLESKDNILSGYYATEENQWVRLGRFGNYFEFAKVGIGVSNVGAANNVVGLFDYFEIMKR